MKTTLLFMALALSILKGFSQSTCGNLDFEDGNFNNWKTYTGTTDNIDTLTIQSFDPSRFEIMSSGYDTMTGSIIPVVAPGGRFSCRLGNAYAGGEAEKITYTFIVSEENALFIYKYAIVLEDPGHSINDQPQFEVKVLNENGAITNPLCGYYQVSASANIPGFINNGIVIFKDWTTVGIDLSPYIGQTVTICFITKDCSLGGHFGYAYIDAESSKMEINSFACAGNDSIVMSAPYGFDYLWQPGNYTGRVLSVAANDSTISYSCTLTSVTGCQIVLTTTTEIENNESDFNYLSCDKVLFFGESLIDTAKINSWIWDFGDGSFGFGINPVHSYNGDGPYTVQLTETTNKGCVTIISKNVKMLAKPIVKIEPVSICAGISFHIKGLCLKVIPGVTKYLWDFGDGSFSSEIDPEIKYNNPGVYNISLKLTNSPECIDIATTENEIYNCEVQIPNVITPNADGLNESFTIKNLDVCIDKKLHIYNRWGNLVFSSTDYCNSWSPDNLTSGVYYYIFDYSPPSPQGVALSKTGFVTVIK
jgi:gliding motility-associated-like protein